MKEEEEAEEEEEEQRDEGKVKKEEEGVKGREKRWLTDAVEENTNVSNVRMNYMYIHVYKNRNEHRGGQGESQRDTPGCQWPLQEVFPKLQR